MSITSPSGGLDLQHFGIGDAHGRPPQPPARRSRRGLSGDRGAELHVIDAIGEGNWGFAAQPFSAATLARSFIEAITPPSLRMSVPVR